MSVAILCCLLIGNDAGEVVLDRPVPRLLTGQPFQATLNGRMSAAWNNAPLRGVLQRLAATYDVSILLDRRLDPSRELELDVNSQTVLEGIRRIAERNGGAASVVGNTVYVGPVSSASRLRTLVQLRSDELIAPASPAAEGRAFGLVDRRTVHWNDLDEPAGIAAGIARQFQLRIEGAERIPHDLWAGATLPGVNVMEALSLVLVQFDLTFEWTDGARGVRIVPVPDEVRLTRSYPVRGRPARSVWQQWQMEIPGLEGEVSGGTITVRGTLEQHEEVARLLLPPALRRAANQPPAPGAAPLERQQFTLRIENIPAMAVIKRLEMSDVVFEYDKRELAAAGIDLNQPISLDVDKAPAQEFFQAVFEPLKLEFTIDHLTVKLRPKR